MPLSKARMRERKRLGRVKPKSNLMPQGLVKPSEPDIEYANYHSIGTPVKPTQSQKAEWAKFKATQR